MKSSRSKFQGTVQILKFNWAFYVFGLGAIVVGLLVLAQFRFPLVLSVAGWLGIAVAAWWLVGSILASWWIYDASPLMSWGWMSGFAPASPRRWVNLHAGLDESTPQLSEVWGPPEMVLDFFDAEEMTEPSILRARKMVVNEIRPVSASFKSLPLNDGAVDLATVLFAAHEIRTTENRLRFFRELGRSLSSGGRLIVVEHQRDLANFLAFGPGFMHFFPTSSWREMGEAAGLNLVLERRITPFVLAFVWEKK